MRRSISLALALALLFASMGSGVAFAGGLTAQSVSTVGTEAELNAALADPAVTVITLGADITTTAQVNVSRPVTIDGNTHSLTVGTNLGTVNGTKHALTLYGSGTPGTIVVQNLMVDSASLAYGVNAYGGAVVQLQNVAIRNSRGAGLTVNGSDVTATLLNTSGNAWGAVNVDPGVGVVTPSVFTLNSGTLAEVTKIWSDGSNPGPVVVNASAAGFASVPTGTGLSLWTVPRTVNVTTGAELVAAIHDLQPGDTIVMAAGTYDVKRDLGDIYRTVFTQNGWYLPIYQPGVTLKGTGDGTIITSSVESANGVWASQSLISVWANNVTIDGVKVLCKAETNKAIEVMGKNFTLKNTSLWTNPNGPEIGGPFARFSGSIYFNPQAGVTGAAKDVGQSRLENVYVDSAWVSARTDTVATGTITLAGVTLNWIDAYHAPARGGYLYGMMSANPPVFKVERDVLFVVDDTMGDITAQAASRLPAGGVLEVHGFRSGFPGSAFRALQATGGPGMLTFSSPDAPVSGRAPYKWTFPMGTLSASYDATFYPGVVVRTTLETPLRYGLGAVELDLVHAGALPGPASLEVYVGSGFAGKGFDVYKYSPTAGIGTPLDRVTVDTLGFATLSIDSGDEWYLFEHRDQLVSFDAAGGSSVAPQTVAYGSLATEPSAPTKPGYVFDGWYKNAALTYAWDFASDVVTGDITLYAKYTMTAKPSTSITIKTSATSVSNMRPFILTGVVKPGLYQDPVVVWVRKPGTSRWSYSSARLAYSVNADGSCNWWYRYTPKLRGTYAFKATFAGDETRLGCETPNIVYVTVR